MGRMFCIMILMALLFAIVLLKITFCILRVMVSLIILPIIMLPMIIVAAVFCMLLTILGLMALPIILPVLLILFIFLVLPFLLIKCLVC
jgi:hypothetical protein